VLGVLTAHVKRGWRANKNRPSGMMLLAVNGFLIVSGYGLYYAGNENFRAWLSRWHGWIGLSIGVILPAHVLLGRVIMRQLHGRKMMERAKPKTHSQRSFLP
jgi:hypothetical protein